MKFYYSIGCDCHPAHVLKTLDLRKNSSPFDSLDINPINTFEYFYELIQTEFKYFMQDLIINDEYSRPSSKHYQYSFFHHDKKINKDNTIKEKYLRRITCLLNHYTHFNCIFLVNIKSSSIISCEIASKLYLDCLKIINDDTFIKNNHIIFIYIRYDEDLNENKESIDVFYTKIKEINSKNIFIIKYNRHLKKDGIWGNTKMYHTYFNHLLTLNS
jgi:hypothetical protein